MPASEVTYGEYVAGLRMLLLQNHRLSADANDFSGAADLYAEVVKLDDLCAHFVSVDLRSRVGAMMTGKPADLSNARKAAENVLSALKAAIEAPGTAGNPSAQLSGALDKLATFLNSGGAGYAYVNKRSVLGNEPKQISDADFVFQLYQDLATLFQELRRPASKNDREATELAGYMLAIQRWAGVPADLDVAVNTWVDQHVSADQEPAKSLASAIGDCGNNLRILPVRHGEPHGRLGRIGPLDPVAPVRPDVEPVAGTEHAVVRLVGEAQPRRAREQHHPLGLRLIVPEPGRAPLPAGDDALDAQPRRGKQRVGDFGGARVRQVAQEVPGRAHGAAAARTPATARCHPAWRPSRSASDIAGKKMRSAAQRAIIAAGAGHSPRASPAT